MMRSDTLNWHDSGGYTEMTAPSMNVYSTDEDKSKSSIVNKTLSQNYSVDMDKLCSTEIDKLEYTITEKMMKGMRLHLMCLIVTYVTYLNAEETILTCRMKKCTWILKSINTLQTFLTI